MFIALKAKGYLFYFISDNALEPMCVNVESNDRRQYAKFWLNPLALDRATGFKSNELGHVTDMVISHLPTLRKEWGNFFKDKTKGKKL